LANLLNLDQVGRRWRHTSIPTQSIRRNAAQILQQRVLKSLSPGNLFSGVLELKDWFNDCRPRLNRFFDALANNEFKVSVDAIDEKTLILGFQKIANRITVGLIIAALIVGAALLMRVDTNFRIWGYPGGCGIIFFFSLPRPGWDCSALEHLSTTSLRVMNPCELDPTRLLVRHVQGSYEMTLFALISLLTRRFSLRATPSPPPTSKSLRKFQYATFRNPSPRL